MIWIKSIGFAWFAVIAATACGGDEGGADEDRGPVEDIVEFADRINWPGIDRAESREIPFIRGFGEDGPAAYWFLGFASRRTADSFWFCREGDTECPLDANQRLNWDRLVGNPLFTRLPGQEGFSPFWQMWTVRVPEDYEPDFIKTIDTLNTLQDEGTVAAQPFILDFGELFGEVIGPQEVILHCALVLTGTTLAENGELMPDGVTPMLALEVRAGWHEGYRVEFVDFSLSDGVFAEADDSENRPLMRKANIYIHWRLCEGDPMPEICDIQTQSDGERPVSERGLGEDITGDGDTNDTNNTLGSVPCKVPLDPEELPYSPLWGVNKVMVQPGASISLIDTTGDQLQSDIKSAVDMFAAVDLGDISEPEPQTEDSSGNPVPGNDGQIFFNCPNPVPTGYVPFPCSDNQ